MNRKLAFDLTSDRIVEAHQDALFHGAPGTGKSHLGHAIGYAVIKQNYGLMYREAHILLQELADATLDGSRKEAPRRTHCQTMRVGFWRAAVLASPVTGLSSVFKKYRP